MMAFIAMANTMEWLAAALVLTAMLLGRRIAPFLPLGMLDWPLAPRWQLIPIATAIFLVVLMSASEVTQFQTADEQVYLTYSILNPAQRGMEVWLQGGLHTGQLIFVLIARIGALLNVSDIGLMHLIKVVHWFIGATVLLCIVAEAARIPESGGPAAFWILPILYLTLFSLPIVSLALKTANYDSLSLLLSVLAILLSFRMVTENRPSARRILAPLAVILATLAAQEKAIASPILLVVCVLSGVAYGLADARKPFRAAAIAAALAVAGAAAVSLLSSLLLAVELAGEPAQAQIWPALGSFIDPLVVWSTIPLRFLFRMGDQLNTLQDRQVLNWSLIVPVMMVVSVCAGAGQSLLRQPFLLTWGRGIIKPIVPIAIVGLVALGVAGILFVQPFWAPMEPVPEGGVALGDLNGARLHFRSMSWPAHYANALLFAYGVIVATTPTAVILLGLLGAIAGARSFWQSGAVNRLELLLLAAFAMPAIEALAGVPTFHRYMNLPILLWVLVTVILGTELLVTMLQKHSAWFAGLVSVLAAALLLEVAPFRPLNAAFRTFWVAYAEPDRAQPGKLNFSWTGWGEETLLAGKELERRCRSSPDGRLAGVACRHIALEAFYPSKWLPQPGTRIRYVDATIQSPDKWPDGAGHYYVINRQAVVGGMLKALPETEPEFSVGYRGFAIAWVYRGDRLRASGYQFLPP